MAQINQFQTEEFNAATVGQQMDNTDIEIAKVIFILLNLWYTNTPAFTSLISSVSSPIFFILFNICQVVVSSKHEFTHENLFKLGFKSKSEIDQYLEPGIAFNFFSDILTASKFRKTLIIHYEQSINSEMIKHIQEINSLETMYFSAMLDINLDNLKQLKEITITDIVGYADLNGFSFQFNKKLEKVNLHYGSVWNSNHAILDTLFEPLINIREIVLTDTDVGDDFFASLQNKRLNKINLNAYYTKQSRNEFVKFLKSQENCLQSIDFFTEDSNSINLLELAQADEDRTVLSQLYKITTSTSILDRIRPHYPHYNIRKLSKMFINVETIIFYFNNYKEIETLLRTLGSFKKISMIKFIDKQNLKEKTNRKHIRI